MKLKIEDVKIGNRIRQDAGDLSQLKRSIQEVGLITPIILNEKNDLLSGFRRLQACRELGWSEIEVRVIITEDDDVKKLDLECHENFGRLDLSVEEQENYNNKRYELLHPQQFEFSFWSWLKSIWHKIMALFSRFQRK